MQRAAVLIGWGLLFFVLGAYRAMPAAAQKELSLPAELLWQDNQQTVAQKLTAAGIKSLKQELRDGYQALLYVASVQGHPCRVELGVTAQEGLIGYGIIWELEDPGALIDLAARLELLLRREFGDPYQPEQYGTRNEFSWYWDQRRRQKKAHLFWFFHPGQSLSGKVGVIYFSSGLSAVAQRMQQDAGIDRVNQP